MTRTDVDTATTVAEKRDPSSRPGTTTGKPLAPAAQRALAEAEERRRAGQDKPGEPHGERPKEVNGRGGAEPVRFGDWEVKGIATDF